jgi:membrane protein YdbS with pleckstrin-like domain
MTKLPKDKRDKIILISMGTVVACAAVWFLLIASQRATLAKARQDAEKSREQLEAGQRTVKSQALVKQEFEEISKALRQRESAMASPHDMYLWQIETLNKFRSNYKVEIPQFGREMASEVGAFPKFPYQAAVFNVRGSAHFHDFGRFLADFENSFPYIRVQNIDMEPLPVEAGDDSTREKLGFKIELLTLVRPNAL